MEMEKLKEDEPEWGGVPHNKTRNGDWKLETIRNIPTYRYWYYR
jgi:hypothetical protein